MPKATIGIEISSDGDISIIPVPDLILNDFRQLTPMESLLTSCEFLQDCCMSYGNGRYAYKGILFEIIFPLNQTLWAEGKIHCRIIKSVPE